MVLKQLEKFYGRRVRDFLNYEDVVWANEIYTSSAMNEFLVPQSNFGHPVYSNTYLNGRFIMAGTETSRREGGFMEGAVLSAQFISQVILQGHSILKV